MQVDDESTIADLRRYDLLVFGGWNTMYAPIRDLLERYVKKLASEVNQSATISSETPGETDAICFSVYRNKAYFLNMDTRRARTFDYVLDGKRGTMTLKPCEIRIIDR